MPATLASIFMPQINVDDRDFHCIIDALKGQLTRAQSKRASELVERLTNPYQPKGANWVPMARIKPSWPSGLTKSSPKHNSFYSKPRATKSQAKPPTKVPLTAEQILSSL
jgi:hypothetical protein